MALPPDLGSRIAAFLLFAIMQLAAHEARAQQVIRLTDAQASQDVSTASTAWVDDAGQADIALITRMTSGTQQTRTAVVFQPTKANTIYRLGRKAVLWQHYRVARSADSRSDWLLEFPQPLLDHVTVYQNASPSASTAAWTSETAGDTVPVVSWPEPGRYTQFSLRLPDADVHDVYVRIQHATSLNLPAIVATQASQSQRLQTEYLCIGVVFGALLLLIVACITQSRVYKDRAYAWYALYASMLTLLIAAWTGVAGHLLWNQWASWNDTAPGALGVMAGGTGLLVIYDLCGGSSRYKWFEPLVRGLGFACVPVALIYATLERNIGVPVIGAYLIGVVLAGQAKAWMSWRRRDAVGLWVLLAVSCMSVAALMVIFNVLGFIPSSWATRYGLMAGLAVEVPLLLVALNLRSRERHSVEARAQALVSQDALTGLLTPHIFHDRFKQVVVRARRYREEAAVIYIELVNYHYIKKNWGSSVAEQSLLRSVIKLRRILRDVDTVGRIDEARFGLILEGESSRLPVTELAARLIAAGLMPLKGLKPEVILQFHVAAVLLGEYPGNEIKIDEALVDLVQQMGSRSRRPIRFLEPEDTRPAPLETDSGIESLPSVRDLDIAGRPHIPFNVADTSLRNLI